MRQLNRNSKVKDRTSHRKEKMTVGSRRPARDAWLCEKYRTARLKGQVILAVRARIQQNLIFACGERGREERWQLDLFSLNHMNH